MTKNKIIKIAVILIFAAALGYLVYPDVLSYYQGWKMGRAYEKFEKGWNDYFKNDAFGGKIPQETYELYIAALKRGDIDSASKYFYWKKTEEQKKKLEDLKAKGELEKYIGDLPEWGEMREEEYWDKEGKKYSYKYILVEDRKYYDKLLEKWDIQPAGEYSGEIIVQLNTYANIWKIYSL